MADWDTLDLIDLWDRMEEQTTSGAVGAFAVPLGTPVLRRPLEDLVGSPVSQGVGGSAGYEDAFDYLRKRLG